MEDPEPAEHLLKIKMEDGTFIEFKRTDDQAVLICHKDQCIRFPQASGQLTVDLVELLSSFGKIEEEK